MSAQPITEAWDDLDDFMSDVGPVDVSSIDQTMAERMLRRVLRLRRQFDADAEVAKAQHDQVDAWLAGRRERLESNTDYLVQCLRQFHEARLELDPKAKTIHLPSGSLVARKRPDSWVFDDDAFVEWATAERPDLVRTKVEPDKAAAKQALFAADDGRVLNVEGGEYVASVHVEPGEIAFTVKAEEDR